MTKMMTRSIALEPQARVVVLRHPLFQLMMATIMRMLPVMMDPTRTKVRMKFFAQTLHVSNAM